MKILNNFLLFCTALAMISCDGPIGYLIHVNKTDKRCYEYRSNDEVDDDTIRFVIGKENQMLMKAEINGVEDTVMYDSGAGTSAVLFYNEENKPDDMKFYRMYITGADKLTKVRMTKIPINIKTPMCIVNHVGDAMLMSKEHFCDNEIDITRHNIIGFAGLNYRPLAFNFTKNQIYHINDISLIDTTGYIPVKCKLKKNVLFIYPVINGVEYECIFDTGNGAGILLKDKQRVKNRLSNDVLYEGSWGKAAGGTTKKQLFVISQENTIDFAGTKDTTSIIYLGGNLAFNNVGLSYIRKFDWIIDTEYDTIRIDSAVYYETRNYKLYAKPHEYDTIKKTKDFPPYLLTSANNTLTILTRLLDGNEVFKVGDKIVSVNGEEITAENICHYYDLLTESKDWSKFDIKVK